MRLRQARGVDFRKGKRLGFDDRLVTWSKPAQRQPTWTPEEFAALPDTLAVRLVRLRVAAAGFRTRVVVLATTLLDPAEYPAEELRALYGQRWQVEGHFCEIKETLALDVRRCESPAMVEREVALHRIAYNLVRALMRRAAHGHGVALGRVSFKGTLDALDALRQWGGAIAAAGTHPRKQDALIAEWLAASARDPVPERPGRSEPRARKRRPKNYHLLTRPRSRMGNVERRNRPRKKHPKTRLS